MKAKLHGSPIWSYPLRTWILVVAVISATEMAVMVALPWLLPRQPSLLLEAAADSVLLTLVVAPLLWWFIERPLRETNRLRADFLTEFFARTEAERRQVAGDLHDGVGQSLTLLVSGLKSLTPLASEPEAHQRIEKLQRLSWDALQEVKRLSLGLRSSMLDDLGLVPALERIVEDVRAHQTIEVAFEAADLANRRLPEPLETALYRIAQESLTNIVKHAHAHHVSLTLRLGDGAVELAVRDDGIGIPEQFLRGSNGRHLGITGMRERTMLLGGELTIQSVPGQGTTLLARLPYEEPA